MLTNCCTFADLINLIDSERPKLHKIKIMLTHFNHQRQKAKFANCVDPDEAAHNLDLHCLSSKV